MKPDASRCKLLWRERINNKVKLDSSGNYIPCPVINHNGREFFKKAQEKRPEIKRRPYFKIITQKPGKREPVFM